jgi:hypothetical protein
LTVSGGSLINYVELNSYREAVIRSAGEVTNFPSLVELSGDVYEDPLHSLYVTLLK